MQIEIKQMYIFKLKFALQHFFKLGKLEIKDLFSKILQD